MRQKSRSFKSTDPPHDARLVQIIRRHLHLPPIARRQAHEPFPHLARNRRQHLMFVVQLHPKHRPRQHREDLSFYFNMLFHCSLFCILTLPEPTSDFQTTTNKKGGAHKSAAPVSNSSISNDRRDHRRRDVHVRRRRHRRNRRHHHHRRRDVHRRRRSRHHRRPDVLHADARHSL